MGAINSKRYKALFFDLDHTLWDYSASSKETLTDIYNKHLLNHDLFIVGDFLKNFDKINGQLWNKYNKGIIDKAYIRENRFDQILSTLGLDDKALSGAISTEYLFECPRRPNLLPHTKSVLDALQHKYPMYILTNGFEDVQTIKLESSGLHNYFELVITSDGCGFKKPDATFFNHSLEQSGYQPNEALMIGDNLKTDIAGALNMGIDTVYFNPSRNGRPHKSTFEISSLDQLLQILG